MEIIHDISYTRSNKQKLMAAGWYPERSKDQEAMNEWQAHALLLEQEGLQINKHPKVELFNRSGTLG
jgi:hypothetical protein